MTSIDRFDPFELRIASAIDEIAAPRRPDYIDDILRQTARSSQRPRWSFAGRWLPMDTTLAPARGAMGRIPTRTLLIVALVALTVGAGLIIAAGSRDRSAPPYGLAQNGQVAYPADGDLWVADAPGVEPRVLVANGGIEFGGWYSPDGDRLLYLVSSPAGEQLWVVGADGSNPRRLHDGHIAPFHSSINWSPDSSTVAIAATLDNANRLLIASADGSDTREVDPGDKLIWDVVFDPRNANHMLLRVQDRLGPTASLDLVVADASGSNQRALGLLRPPSAFGAEYTLSGAEWSPGADVIAFNGADVDPTTLTSSFRVHLVNADGSGERALPGPTDPNIQEGWPAFSPDGKWLLVHRWVWRDTGDDLGDGWLAIAPADGSAPARDIGPRLTDGDFTDVAKAWSPDGTNVLMWHENGDVWVIDPFAGTSEKVEGVSLLPNWQRRGP